MDCFSKKKNKNNKNKVLLVALLVLFVTDDDRSWKKIKENVEKTIIIN
jgi:hypothetical protein